jgi:hypothetical protein
MFANRSHRKTLTGVLACAIAYLFFLQTTLAATLIASQPLAASLASEELCLSHTHSDGDNGVDTEHVNAAGHCLLCLAPGFGLLPSPPPAVVVRTALGITFEPTAPAPIIVTQAPSQHRARAPPLCG